MASIFANVLNNLHTMEKTTSLGGYAGVLSAPESDLTTLGAALEDALEYLPEFIGAIGELQRVATKNIESSHLDTECLAKSGTLIYELTAFLGVVNYASREMESNQALKRELGKQGLSLPSQ